jgi:hypothetical protein
MGNKTLDREKILAILSGNSETIHKFGIEKIGLFGSFVNNQFDEKSDIDILIKFIPGCKNFDNLMGLKLFLEDLFSGRQIDLVIEESIKARIKEKILSEVKYAS